MTAIPASSGPVRTWASPADRFVLRLAVGVTLGFAIALSLGWQFSFLTPMLTVQILAASPRAPTLGQGLAIPLVLLIASNAALAVAVFLSDAPAVQLAIIGVVVLWSFYAQRRGAPGILVLLVQLCFCAIPLFSTINTDLGHILSGFLVRSSFAAAATVWICHALVPVPPMTLAPAAAPAKPSGLEATHAARVAISDTLVLMPLIAWFMIDGRTSNLVILVTTINLLREIEIAGTQRMAFGLVVGNVLGAMLAVFIQQIVFLADNIANFLLTVFLSGLWFGSRIAKGGALAPIFGIAIGTYILILGLAITPLPGGSEESAVVRVIKITAAGLYALGALSLTSRLRRPPA